MNLIGIKYSFFGFFFIAFLAITANSELLSQDKLYRVFFNDKGAEEFKPGSAIYDSTLAILTEKALKRRAKYLPDENLINLKDAPVYQPYIEQIIDLGALIKHELRWENYALIYCTSEEKEMIEELPFVRNIKIAVSKAEFADVENERKDELLDWLIIDGIDESDYGYAEHQLKLLNVQPVHELGIYGEDILLAIFDTGFNIADHEALKNANIVSVYDFANNDSIVTKEVGDHENHIIHGTTVFSVIGAFQKDSLIGVAPGTDFILATTEDLNSETRAEEDNLAAAIEWAESQGVDIVTMSIGYRNFDLEISYDKEDLDGNSTISARYVNEASKRGVLCISAAGNNGPEEETLITPSDADSILSVGGYDWNGVDPAGFTSYGTTRNGETKPDIAAQAVSVFGVEPFTENRYKGYKGTSFATPLIAGSASLILSAFPEKTPYQIKSTLKESGTFYEKDTKLGYGMPDIYNALLNTDILIKDVEYERIDENLIEIRCKVYSNYFVNSIQCKIIPENGLENLDLSFEYYDENSYRGFAEIGKFRDSINSYYLVAYDQKRSRRSPFDNSKFYDMFIKLPVDSVSYISDKRITFNVELKKDFIHSTNILRLMINSDMSGVAHIEIFNSLGKEIYNNSTIRYSVGTSESQIDVSSLNTGNYYLMIKTSYRSIVKKFLIIK